MASQASCRPSSVAHRRDSTLSPPVCLPRPRPSRLSLYFRLSARDAHARRLFTRPHDAVTPRTMVHRVPKVMVGGDDQQPKR